MQDVPATTRSSHAAKGSPVRTRNPEAARAQQHKQPEAGIRKQPGASQKHPGSRLDGQASTPPFKIQKSLCLNKEIVHFKKARNLG